MKRHAWRYLKFYCMALIALGGLLTGHTYGREYPYLYRSGYYLGRGDTGIAVADGEESIFYNPAGLAAGQGVYKQTILGAPMLEISQDTRDVINRISIQEEDPTDTLRDHLGQPQHVGLNMFSGVILRRAALGVFAHSSNTALLYKDPTKGALESLFVESIADAGAVFTLAHDFTKNLNMGLTAKYIQRNQAYFSANATDSSELNSLESSDQISMLGTGTGVDLGLMYRQESRGGRDALAFGLTVADVGDTTFTPNTPTTLSRDEWPLRDIKQTVNAGVAFEKGAQYSKFRLLLDLRDLLGATGQHATKKFHLGGELSVGDTLGFTSGLNQGYPTFGMYTDIHVLRIDLGFYGEEVGDQAGSRPDTRYYIKLRLGL